VKNILAPGGVVVSNILAPDNNRFFFAMIRTLEEVFGRTSLFKGEESNNYIFVSTVEKHGLSGEEVTRRARTLEKDKNLGFDLGRYGWSMQNAEELDAGHADILTDDFAPVNLLRHMEKK